MTRPELLALAGRLEAATAGSRELDRLVLTAAGWTRAGEFWQCPRTGDRWTLVANQTFPSTSLDAITALIEAAGMIYASGKNGNGDTFWSLVMGEMHHALTEPLARSAAFCRALAAEATDAR